MVAILVLLGLAGTVSAQEGEGDLPTVRRDATWHVAGALAGGPADLTFTYGREGDVPLRCDWNGDGTPTPAVVRDSVWHIRDVNAGGAADTVFTYGRAGDTPICGDWNGDGAETPGVVRTGEGGPRFHLRDALAGGVADHTFVYGRAGDVPMAGDWTGDGTTTVGVIRDGNRWLLRDANRGGAADLDFRYGRAGDVAVAGDWNEDGRQTPGVVRDGRRWLVRNSNRAGVADVGFTYGRSGDVPFVRHTTNVAESVEPPEPGSVSGTVTSSDTGMPIEDASVEFAGEGDTTGSDGGYEVDGVSPGTHTLTISAEGYETHDSAVDVPEGAGTTADADLALAQGWVLNLDAGEVYESFSDALASTDMDFGHTLRGHGEFDEDFQVNYAGATIESGAYDVTVTGAGNHEVIQVTAPNVTIDGLDIRGHAPGTSGGTTAGVSTPVDDLTVRDSHIADIADTSAGMGVGVHLFGSTDPSGAVIDGNTFENLGDHDNVLAAGYGVLLDDQAGGTPGDVTVEGNTFVALATENGDPGVGVLAQAVDDASGDQLVIVGNDFSAIGGGSIGFDLRGLDDDSGAVRVEVGGDDNVSTDPGDMLAIGLRDSHSHGEDDLDDLTTHWFCRDLDVGASDHVGYFGDEDTADGVCSDDDHVFEAPETVYEWPWDWSFLDTGDTISNYRLSFADADHGWAVGNDEIIHTDDGGDTWEEQDYPAEVTGSARVMRHVFFLDEDTGWAVGQHSTIIYTTDGGDTWEDGTDDETVDCHLNKVRFHDADEGLKVCGSGVFQSIDGGETWSEIDLDDLDPGTLTRHATVVDDGDHLAWVATADGDVLFSDDPGDEESWVVQSTPTDERLEDVYFVDADHGWAVDDEGGALYTTDGGENWQMGDTPISGLSLEGVEFLDENTGWAVGQSGTLLETTDGGENWSHASILLERPGWNVSVVDDDHVWVGKQRQILRLR